MNLIESTCVNTLAAPTFCRVTDRFLANILIPISLGYAAMPLMTLIHESGHAIAAYLLYKNANPRITLNGYGFKGGRCIGDVRLHSKMGKWVGKRNASALTAAAGPVTVMITALALHYFYPGNGISSVTLHDNTIYALSTFKEKAFFRRTPYNSPIGHDFVRIKIAKGIRIATLFIIINLAVEIFSIYLFAQKHKQLL